MKICMKSKGVGIMNKKKTSLLSVFIDIIKLSPLKFFLEYFFTILGAVFNGLIAIQFANVFVSVTAYFENTKDFKNVLLTLSILLLYNIALQVSDGLSNYFGEFYFSYSSQNILKKLNIKVAKLPPVYFEDPKTMNLIESANIGARNVRQVLNIIMDILCLYIPYYIIIGAYLFSIKPILSFALLFVFIPVLIGQIIKSRIYSQLEENQSPMRRKKDTYSKYVSDRVYLKETRTLRANKYFFGLFKNVAVKFYDLNLLFQRKSNRIDAIAQLFTLIGYVGVILISIVSIIKGDIAIASFAAIYASLSELFGLMEELVGWRMEELSAVYGKVKKYIEFLNLESVENIEISSIMDIDTIQLRDVSFSYPTKDNVLKNINLNLKVGDSLAIIGENGSGKTTLSRLILGLYSPNSGDIFYNNVSSKDLSFSQIRNNSSAVFQNFNRYKMSLDDNIRISNLNNNDSQKGLNYLTECLNWSGIDEKNPKFNYGLETNLSSEFGGIDLSGGEWQRIAIARGIYKNHNIIVLDEPTSAIDPVQESEILVKFKDLSPKAIKIIVTHRLAAVKYCTKILVLQKGKIVAEGSHEELLNNSLEYVRLWESQAKLYA